jgi:hypothetical protein
MNKSHSISKLLQRIGPHQCFGRVKIAAATAITAPMRFADVSRVPAEGSADKGICPFVDFTLHTSTVTRSKSCQIEFVHKNV